MTKEDTIEIGLEINQRDRVFTYLEENVLKNIGEVSHEEMLNRAVSHIQGAITFLVSSGMDQEAIEKLMGEIFGPSLQMGKDFGDAIATLGDIMEGSARAVH